MIFANCARFAVNIFERLVLVSGMWASWIIYSLPMNCK
ncbi:glycine oxidase ThiO [Alicyclobacillus hesperidum URH17-3-68]|nr:glycine oxidase ThiO [Alicyclobacillus hesperidum URH17-3-68]